MHNHLGALFFVKKTPRVQNSGQATLRPDAKSAIDALPEDGIGFHDNFLPKTQDLCHHQLTSFTHRNSGNSVDFDANPSNCSIPRSYPPLNKALR